MSVVIQGLRKYVEENVGQYERALAFYHMTPDHRGVRTGQLERDRSIVEAGLKLSGARDKTVKSLLDITERHAEADAQFHKHLIANGAETSRLRITTRVKNDYRVSSNKERAISAIRDLGYTGTDDELIRHLEDIKEIDDTFWQFIETAAKEIHQAQVTSKDPRRN